MSQTTSGEIILNEPIAAVLDIESHLFSSRSADLYRGIDLSDGSSVSFWLTRGPLSAEQKNAFISKLAKIESLRLPNCPLRGFGVDSEGQGFALFPRIDSSAIVPSGNASLDSREAERRFAPCLQTLEKIHSAGIVLGDLCSSSFIIDRSGRILFLGVMGDLGVESESNSTQAELSVEVVQYLAPEQRKSTRSDSSNTLTQATDVYAIGVLGYRLFGGKYPFAANSAKQLRDPAFEYPAIAPLNSTSGSIPVWCNEIFLKCLHTSPQVRFSNATDLNTAIQALRQKALFASEAPLVIGTDAGAGSKSKQRQEGAATYEPLGDRKSSAEVAASNAERKNSIAKIIFAAVCILGLILGAVLMFRTSKISIPKIATAPKTEIVQELVLLADATTDPKIKAAIDVLAIPDSSIEDRELKLNDLVSSDDPISHQVLVVAAASAEHPAYRDQVHKAILNRVERLAEKRSAEQLRRWLNTLGQGQLPEIYEAMLTVVNPRQPIAAREALLRQIYPQNSKAVLRLAAAIALDAPNIADYQGVISQLVGDSLSINDARSKSTLALLLAQADISEVFGEDIVSRKSEIPDQDLPWILNILASRNDLNVRQFAQLALEKGQISPSREIFLDLIKEREDLPIEIIISLVRAGSGSVTADDVAQFGLWIDALSEKVLLALCTDIKDPVLLGQAFETLAAKPLTITPATELIEIIRNKYWEQKNNLAALVAAASLPGVVDESSLRGLVENLGPFLKDAKFIELFATSQDPYLPKIILERFSDNLGFGVLLKLLNNKDKEVRIKAITTLKRFNEIGVLRMVIAQYEKEKDPEVIKVYRDSFWMIAEKENKNQ